MKKAFAVIGTGYGDEGKGLTTDFLVRKYQVEIVARGNGGAQAGHTVVTKLGQRHVFGHVGAGHFAGARTYLGSNFILNPILLENERKDLGRNLAIHASAKCRVTTIFDMALNGLQELSRKNRHGSCGVGINETVTRHQNGYQLTLREIQLCSIPMLCMKLRNIFKEYWLDRVNTLVATYDMPEEAKDLLAIFDNPDFEKIAIELKSLLDISTANPSDLYPNTLVVEGAQGLMLDEYLGAFPHVTRSITGLPSALLAAHELNHETITPIYVMRAYTTRHGAGHLVGEGQPISNVEIPADKTNVHNQWQQNFRYAPLNLHKIARFIRLDLNRSRNIAELLNIQIDAPQIMLTCMDQLGDIVNVQAYENTGEIKSYPKDELPALIKTVTGLNVKFVSYGETAEDVKEL